MFIVNLIPLVVFCISERFGVMKVPYGGLFMLVVSITICLSSCASPIFLVLFIISPFSLDLGVDDLVVLIDFLSFLCSYSCLSWIYCHPYLCGKLSPPDLGFNS